MRAILLRHGETVWNRERRIQGHADVPLTPLGRWQAYHAGFQLRHERASAIYASDLCRARETALVVADVTGLPLLFDARLRERDMGDLEGRPLLELAGRLGVEVRDGWAEFGDPRSGAEAWERVRARMEAALDDLAHRHRDSTVIIVTHGGAINSLWPAAERRSIGNGSFIELWWPRPAKDLVEGA